MKTTTEIFSRACSRNFLFAVASWLVFANISHAQLHFPAMLRNELDNTPLDDSARNVLVLIHGWNPSGNLDSFRQGSEWNSLLTDVQSRLSGSGWKLVLYHWETDANTGPVLEIITDALGYGNATVAAIRAQQHGQNLADFAADLQRWRQSAIH